MPKQQSNCEIEVKVMPSHSDNSVYPLQTNPAPRRPPRPQPLPMRRKWAPWLVPTFVVANVTMFAVSMYVNNCTKNSDGHCFARFLGRFAFQPLKENPLLGPSSTTLDKMGALDVNKVVNGHQGWRLISCIWLHAGVVHVLVNMLSLLAIGIRLEQDFGFVKIGILYAISGLGGSLLSALFIQSSISVGASGALFGLLGAMLSELIMNWTIYTNKIVSLVTLVLIIVLNLAVGLLPHVDNFAHIGGFLSGFLLGFVLLIRPQFGWTKQKGIPPERRRDSVRHKYKIYQYILWIIAAIILIVGFTVGLILLFRGFDANDHCSWCRYLSCVPTSKRSCKSSSTTLYCTSSQNGTTLTVTCDGSGRSRSYLISNATDRQIKAFCNQLCN